MTTCHAHVYATPAGAVLIEAADGVITRIIWGASGIQEQDSPSALTNACANELLEYLAGKRRVFSASCRPRGSAFQEAVWQAAEGIPYGQTRTCTDIADAIGRPDSRRQVGRAAAACPCAPLIPVHRITSLDDPFSRHLRTLES